MIVPWNLPLLLTWKVAPALAAGNAVVVKPSEFSPMSATLLAEVLTEAGLPAGAYNVVHGFGPGSAGEFLTRHRDVDAITFTGEPATGSAIMSAAAATLTPMSFELGGKNAALVFADADLDRALDGTARSVCTNTGQVCLCTERIYVQRRIFDESVARLVARAEALVPGHPDNPATTLGPLISREHREKVQSYCDVAVKEGASILTGGHATDLGSDLAGGAYFAPTIWTGLDQSARLMNEEVSGPVCHVTPFDTDAEACHPRERLRVRPRRDPLDRQRRPGPTASRSGSTSGSHGSTPGGCATCAVPSAATADPASAAKAGGHPSSSTAAPPTSASSSNTRRPDPMTTTADT